MGNHTEIAEMLFEKLGGKINPNIQNYGGDTPVHKAVEKNHLNFLKILISNGATTKHINKKGRDPASLALSQDARDILKSAQIASTTQGKVDDTPAPTESSKDEKKTPSEPVNKAAYVPAQFDPDMIANDDSD